VDAGVSLLARRVAVPEPVLLSLAGLIWSQIPALPRPQIEPEFVLAVLLPPLLYSEAWSSSWLDFRRWLRPILQLAVGLVALTILAVGLVAHWAMPGLPLPVCFLLGAIVSPTDTVAVQSVLDRLRVPRRTTAILGGESLVNDATGLLGVGLATLVVITGVFEPSVIGLSFARIAGLGLAIGAAIGWAAAALNYRVRGTQVLFAFSLVAPYAAYFAAEHTGASGILAVVVAGFVSSWRLHYIAPESRVELYSAWDQLDFVLHGLMFLFIGLEALPLLFEALESAPGVVNGALLVSATVVLVRAAWMFPAAYLPLALAPRLRALEGGYPDPRSVLIGAWCGVRGAVSLAAALSVPELVDASTPFPGRTQIIACTLVVILVTLFGQGLTLLPLVRRLGLSDADPSAAEVRRAREGMLEAGIRRLDGFCSEQSCPIAVYRYRDAMADELEALRAEDELARARARERQSVALDVRRAVYQAQADALLELRDQGTVNDLVHQELQLSLDRANADLAEG
jgi:CPA1 family monovalent cation:H+ antiporter